MPLSNTLRLMEVCRFPRCLRAAPAYYWQMLRIELHRLAAALLGPWFVLSVADLNPLDHCPMHHPAAVAMAGMAAGGHGMAHSPGSNRPSAPEHGTTHAGCTCIGGCVGTAPVARLERAATVVEATVTPSSRSPLPTPGVPAGADAQIVLPPAIGPPALHG
jgi:hypothetical protein